jgi:hypothetical protein
MKLDYEYFSSLSKDELIDWCLTLHELCESFVEDYKKGD